MPDDLVTLRTLHDPVQAEMYRDILAQEGIVAMIPGAHHRGMLGLVGGYIEIPVRVPTEDAERAAEILEAIETNPEEDGDVAGEEFGGGLEEPGGGTEGEGSGVASSLEAGSERDLATNQGATPRRKLKRVAFFIAFAIPGGGHFYVGANRLGLAFLIAQISAAIGLLLMLGEAWLALVFYPCLLLADAFGAVSRVGAANGDGPGRRAVVLAARSLVVLPVASILGLYLASERAPEWYSGYYGALLCTETRACASDTPSDCLLRVSRGLRRAELERQAIEDCAECMVRSQCTRLRMECSPLCEGLWNYLGSSNLPELTDSPIRVDPDGLWNPGGDVGSRGEQVP